jgi:hypothetical protein
VLWGCRQDGNKLSYLRPGSWLCQPNSIALQPYFKYQYSKNSTLIEKSLGFHFLRDLFFDPLFEISPDNRNTLSVQGEVDGMEKQILRLNQRKEDLLVDLKATVLNLHQHLKQEQQGAEGDRMSSSTREEGGLAERDTSEWKVGMTSGQCWSHIPRQH